jgi:hypothetical protein
VRINKEDGRITLNVDETRLFFARTFVESGRGTERDERSLSQQLDRKLRTLVADAALNLARARGGRNVLVYGTVGSGERVKLQEQTPEPFGGTYNVDAFWQLYG